MRKNRSVFILGLFSIVLAIILMAILVYVPPVNAMRWKIHDMLVRAEYSFMHKHVTSDIVMVTISNKTLSTIQERWPYSRTKFAKVIDNLKRAGAKIIAFDFIFYGATSPEEDGELIRAMREAGNVVLGTAIDEDGSIQTSTVMSECTASGVVTKFQDYDGITRKALTYLVAQDDRSKVFFSWGLKILKFARGADLSGLDDGGDVVKLSSACGEEWEIPVFPHSKSFFINFQAHTKDFKTISFVDVLSGHFDPVCVKDKIVMIGLTSTIFGDMHNTPLGWIPGITLNANAFLTLYNHDFIREIPSPVIICIVILSVLATSYFLFYHGIKKTALFMAIEIIIFLLGSLHLMLYGLIWNYLLFPVCVIVCPILAVKLRNIAETKKYFT